MGKKIAHVKKNEDGSWAEPQRLDDHLEGTAKHTEEFAQVFSSGAWGRVCGIGHDMGKARETYQRCAYQQMKYNIIQTQEECVWRKHTK